MDEASEDRRIARGAAALLAFGFDLPPEGFFRPSRGRAVEAEARALWLVVIRRATALDATAEPLSVGRIAAAVGRDRSTVSHALHSVEAACEDDPDLDAFVTHYARLARELIAISGHTVAEIEARAEAARPRGARAHAQ